MHSHLQYDIEFAAWLDTEVVHRVSLALFMKQALLERGMQFISE